MALNEARFGDPLLMHGSFGKGPLEHGFTYWGVEAADSARAMAFQEHGRFNVERVVPNLFIYIFDIDLDPVSDVVISAYRDMTKGLGYIRVEPPRFGALFLWLPWCVLIVFGLAFQKARTAGAGALIVATGTSAMLTASYATVTLRYKVDLWPLVATGVMVLLPGVISQHGRWQLGQGPLRLMMVISVTVSVVVNVLAAKAYSNRFIERGLYAVWSGETCALLAQRKGLPVAEISKLCEL